MRLACLRRVSYPTTRRMHALALPACTRRALPRPDCMRRALHAWTAPCMQALCRVSYPTTRLLLAMPRSIKGSLMRGMVCVRFTEGHDSCTVRGGEIRWIRMHTRQRQGELSHIHSTRRHDCNHCASAYNRIVTKGACCRNTCRKPMHMHASTRDETSASRTWVHYTHNVRQSMQLTAHSGRLWHALVQSGRHTGPSR